MPDAGEPPAPHGQPARNAGADRRGPPRLGELLIERGSISRRELAAALRRQRHSGRLLGEELVQAGSVQRRELRAALALQQNLRRAALCSALMVVAMQPVASHAAGTAAQLGVRCVVAPRVQASVDYQTQQIAITADDVARGFVDVAAGSRLTVTTNSRAGYIVDFFTRVAIFKSVRVQAGESGGEIGPDGGTMIERARSGRGMRTEITYRFVLAQGVAPGIYPWPLAIAVRPL